GLELVRQNAELLGQHRLLLRLVQHADRLVDVAVGADLVAGVSDAAAGRRVVGDRPARDEEARPQPEPVEHSQDAIDADARAEAAFLEIAEAPLRLLGLAEQEARLGVEVERQHRRRLLALRPRIAHGLGVSCVAVTPGRPLRVVVAFHSIFYAPLPVAIRGGHFAAEGLEVDPETPALAGGTVDTLLRGVADVSLSGIMRSFELVDRGGARLVHFAAVNDRNGFFLLSREPRPSFAWSNVVGRTIISFGGAPTPWLCMQTVLRRHGVDPARVTFRRDLYRAQRWMAASTAQEIAAVVAPVFGDIDPAIRVAAIERYLKQSTWARDPVLTRTGYDTLQEILLSAGFIKKPHPFDALVDTDIARAAVGY